MSEDVMMWNERLFVVFCSMYIIIRSVCYKFVADPFACSTRYCLEEVAKDLYVEPRQTLSISSEGAARRRVMKSWIPKANTILVAILLSKQNHDSSHI
jgi:hypothetical protein